MSILTGKIQFEPDPAKDYGYGDTYKIKVKPATGDAVTLFVRADHQDAPALTKNATVFYKMVEGKPRFEGVDQAAAASAPATNAPAQSGHPAERPKLAQIVETWAATFALVQEKFPHEDDLFVKGVTSTIFIEACKQGAFAPAGYKAPALKTQPDTRPPAPGPATGTTGATNIGTDPG